MPLSLQDLYGKVTDESNGCCWEMFEAYKQLKSLGYIVARHGVHWTMKKNRKTDSKSDSLEGIPERKTEIARESEERHSLIKLFNNMQINEVKPVFDVYHPDSKFRKSSPGDPCFILCLARGLPPSKAEIEELESRCNGIPLKLCHVEHGRVFQSGVARPTAKIVSESGGFRLVGDGIVASVRFGCTITRILSQMWVR